MSVLLDDIHACAALPPEPPRLRTLAGALGLGMGLGLVLTLAQRRIAAHQTAEREVVEIELDPAEVEAVKAGLAFLTADHGTADHAAAANAVLRRLP